MGCIVVSFGSELWAGLYPFCDDASYMANNPSEPVHMQFLRWYLGARGSTHKRILLHAAHRLHTTHATLAAAYSTTLEHSWAIPGTITTVRDGLQRHGAFVGSAK
jgi:hypothetical protein